MSFFPFGTRFYALFSSAFKTSYAAYERYANNTFESSFDVYFQDLTSYFVFDFIFVFSSYGKLCKRVSIDSKGKSIVFSNKRSLKEAYSQFTSISCLTTYCKDNHFYCSFSYTDIHIIVSLYAPAKILHATASWTFCSK